ncbi:MAG: hypothetical protein IIC18_04035, partial [Bacteroidetes bacterium]|nr:hypothetical protein [Bacteroidota bacterium]
MSEKVTTTRVLLPPSRPLRSGKAILASIDLTLPHTAQGVKAGSAGVLHSALQLHYTGNVTGTLEVWIQELGGDRSSHAKKQTITASASVERKLDIPLPDYPRMRLTLTLDNRNRGTEFRIVRAELVSDLSDEDRLIKILERGAN